VASTIGSVVSGLMVSLAVVVAAILAVVVLVFSDQPATGRAGSRRGPRAVTGPSATTPARPAGSDSARAGPPPAAVLQRQLALPSVRRPPPAGTASPPAAPVAVQPASGPLRATGPAVATGTLGAFELDQSTFWSRLRSSVALLVLLASVGTLFALAIGAAMFLAGLALRHALR
jgi:hypothetical protein